MSRSGLSEVGSVALDHVQVAAPRGCEPAARDFYGGLLGLVEVEKPVALRSGGGVWFELAGGAGLHVGVQSPGFTPAEKAHPALRVPGGEPALRALAARLTAAGAEVEWDDRIPDVPRFHTADPFGNRVELLA